MAVVTIIGIFVALAMPGMSGIIQDRHAARATDDISGLFRVARSRAIATGAAHMVRVTPSAANSRFELRAAMGNLGGSISSCLTPLWNAGDSVELSVIDFAATTGSYSGRGIVVTADIAVATPPARDYCFTPGGATWWRDSGVWQRPGGSQASGYEIMRLGSFGAVTGMKRTFRLSPSGVPRIEVN